MYKYHTTSKTILADLYTPVSAYMRVRDQYPQSALMESSDYHGGENSRSFIGINPIASVAISHGKAISVFPDGSRTEKEVSNTYRCDHAINDFLSQLEVEGEDKNYCGLYGYTTFNAVLKSIFCFLFKTLCRIANTICKWFYCHIFISCGVSKFFLLTISFFTIFKIIKIFRSSFRSTLLTNRKRI
ncbi:MAG: hypothetical protein II623_07620 [Paludibacteraceae bacterium]|nr:hypothetical protein [Paludibacteraceae bacterium]